MANTRKKHRARAMYVHRIKLILTNFTSPHPVIYDHTLLSKTAEDKIKWISFQKPSVLYALNIVLN